MTSYFRTTKGQSEQLDRIFDQVGLTHEDVKRILADPILAAKMVAALNPRPLQFVPSTYTKVEQQLFCWQRLGVLISDERWQHILQQADAFEPVTDTDEPLVTGGFGYYHPMVIVDRLINTLTPAQGYAKANHLTGPEIRYTPGFIPRGELRLVHYDSNAYAKLSPEDARKAAKRDGLRLAGIEVLEYLVLNPESGLKWDGKNFFYPNLSGLERKYEGAWSAVPCVGRWDGSGRKFYFSPNSAVIADVGWSSPVVREC